MFGPLILRKSAGDYNGYSTLSANPFLGRWLVATAVLFLGSASVYGGRIVVRSMRRRTALREARTLEAAIAARAEAEAEAEAER